MTQEFRYVVGVDWSNGKFRVRKIPGERSVNTVRTRGEAEISFARRISVEEWDKLAMDEEQAFVYYRIELLDAIVHARSKLEDAEKTFHAFAKQMAQEGR